MEHAKKMVLVDPQFYRPSIAERALNGLDAQISDILSSDLPDDVKAKRYAEAVRRFGHIKEPIIEPTETKKLTKTDLLDSIPSNSRHKAKRLLDYLKRDGNVHFKDSGEVVYKNETLHNSNIIDLLESAVGKSAPAERATGLEEFTKALKEIRAPRSAVANNAFWQQINPVVKTTIRRSRQQSRTQSPSLSPIHRHSPSRRKRIQPWRNYDD